MKYLLALLTILCISNPLYSLGEGVLGFSDDGKYAAFDTECIFDSCFATYIIDVDKNDYAAKPVKYQMAYADLVGVYIPNEAQKEIYSALNKFGIKRVNKGEEIYKIPSNEWEYKVAKRSYGKLVGTIKLKINNEEYDLILENINTGKFCSFYEKVGIGDATSYKTEIQKMISLRLKKGDKTIILQEDTKLPESRGYPFYYVVNSVNVYKNKIAVVVLYHTSDAELKSVLEREMIVTGKLD